MDNNKLNVPNAIEQDNNKFQEVKGIEIFANFYYKVMLSLLKFFSQIPLCLHIYITFDQSKFHSIFLFIVSLVYLWRIFFDGSEI